MTEPHLLDAARLAAAVCTCGAIPCPDCRGTGWKPGQVGEAECFACGGHGASRPHPWDCPGLHINLIPAADQNA